MHSQIPNKQPNAQMLNARSFSDDARDLLQKILVPDPEERIKMEDILAEPWYKSVRHLDTLYRIACMASFISTDDALSIGVCAVLFE